MLRKTTNPISPYVPSGLIAKTEKGFFYIKGQKRFKFISDRAVESWGLKIVHSNEINLSKLTISGQIGFRDGTLIKDVSDSKIYIISDNKKRHVLSPDVFKNLGYTRNEIIRVGKQEASFHAEGEKIDG